MVLCCPLCQCPNFKLFAIGTINWNYIYSNTWQKLRYFACSNIPSHNSLMFVTLQGLHSRGYACLTFIKCSHSIIICFTVITALLNNTQIGATSSTSLFVKYPSVRKVCSSLSLLIPDQSVTALVSRRSPPPPHESVKFGGTLPSLLVIRIWDLKLFDEVNDYLNSSLII